MSLTVMLELMSMQLKANLVLLNKTDWLIYMKKYFSEKLDEINDVTFKEKLLADTLRNVQKQKTEPPQEIQYSGFQEEEIKVVDESVYL